MAITKLKPSTAAEAFTAEAPDAKPEPKLRGKKRLLAITLPPDLIEALDVAAEASYLSRAKKIELMLRQQLAVEARGKDAA
jgi:hypothetical protein